jgi:hypothetical protein
VFSCGGDFEERLRNTWLMDKSNKKIKWLTYTVGVGMLPILARLLVNFLSNNDANGAIELFATNDFIAFGFVMHISILNEIEHMNEDDNWKTINNFSSIGFVFFFGLLTLAHLLVEGDNAKLNPDTLKYCSMTIAFISFILAHSVFKRLSAKSEVSTYGEATC